MRVATIVTAAALLGGGGASAQDAQLNVFLFERSYAAIGTPTVIGAPAYYDAVAEPPLLAEAQISPHLPLARGMTAQKLRDGQGHGFNLFLTPQIRIRGLDAPSGPVRSPSFMPKFTGQWQWVRSPSPGEPGSRKVLGVNLVLGHHSNGGSTCEFVDEQIQGDEGCVSTLSPVPPANQREFYVDGGNFSTNYVEVGVGHRWGVTDDRGADHWRWALDAALSVQHHHEWFGFPLPGGAKPAFADLYGPTRLRADVAGHVLLGSAVALRVGSRLDAFDPELPRFDGAARHAFEADAFLQLVEGLGTTLPWYLPSSAGLGVRFYHGMDHYNTQFVRDIRHVQLVLVIDAWSPRIY